MNKLLDSSLTRGFSRRSFLVGLGATAALPILAACQPQVVEKTVEVPVIVKETVVVQEVVEKEVIVEKEVVVEVEVEVEKRSLGWLGLLWRRSRSPFDTTRLFQ